MKTCTVCNVSEQTIHGHHVIPQCLGGRDGPVVPLCGTCHNLVHGHALSILSFIKSGGKNPSKSFWSSSEKEAKALPLVNAIVQASLSYDGDKSYKIAAEFDSDTYSKLRHIKKDLALASLEAALIYCVSNVFERYSTNNNFKKVEGKINEKRLRMW